MEQVFLMDQRSSVMRCSWAARLLASLVLVVAAAGLACCDSNDSNVDAVSGSVSGLAPGESVVLELNGKNAMSVSSAGMFTFPVGVSANTAYSVTVSTQPRGQVCTVTNGGGAAITNNVTNVHVACAAQTFTVSGTVTGLAAGSKVVLEDNGADALALTIDGPFRFTTPVAFNGTYAVTVATEPSGAICTVQQGAGAGMTADVASVAVTCSPVTFTVSGTLNGLTSGMQVTLDNNSADPLTLSADGKFTFSTPVAEFGAFNVTVGTQPAGQTCSVTNGQATQVTARVSNITVTCSTNTYTVGGSVSGLGASQQVTLEDDGGDSLIVTANGSFTFATPVAYGGAYTVTVGTQPSGLACLVSNGAASPVSADVTSVDVNCVANTVTFTTPGTYTWTVPNGLTSISIVATGGGGGGGGATGNVYAGTAGGAGAVVTTPMSVTPGQVVNLVVGGGGGAGTNGPAIGSNGYYDGAAGGGGGSSTVDTGSNQEIVAGGGGGGGGYRGGAGGDAGASSGAGENGGSAYGSSGGGGGSGGIGGVAGSGGGSGHNGDGGSGGAGGNNGTTLPGGSGGSGTGAGAGASGGALSGGGGGGYGGGGTGGFATGGGAGGSIGPTGTTYAAAGNGGGAATNGGNGSIVITLQ